MSEYWTHEAAFDVPVGWIDYTVNTLEFSRGDGKVLVVVTRADVGKRTLEKIVEERTSEQRRKLPKFHDKPAVSRMVAGLPAIEACASYQDGDRRTYQRTLTMLHAGRVIIIGASSVEALQGDTDELFDRVTGSVELAARPA